MMGGGPPVPAQPLLSQQRAFAPLLQTADAVQQPVLTPEPSQLDAIGPSSPQQRKDQAYADYVKGAPAQELADLQAAPGTPEGEKPELTPAQQRTLDTF